MGAALPDFTFDDLPELSGGTPEPEAANDTEVEPVGDMPLGVFPDMPNEVYHRSPALSRGGISLLNRSSTAFWYAQNANKRIEKRHFDVGSFFSDLLTFGKGDENHNFVSKHYVREPEVNLRTNDGKAELEGFYSTLASHQVGINHADWSMVTAMRDSFMMNELAREFLLHPDTHAEHSHFTTKDIEIVVDGEVSIERIHVRVRPDLKNPTLKIVADLKTLAPNLKWMDSVMGHGYDLQQVMYSDVIAETEFTPERFWFFVTNKTDENPITKVLTLDDWYVERGEQAYRKGLAKFATLQRTGDWFLPETTEKPPWIKD